MERYRGLTSSDKVIGISLDNTHEADHLTHAALRIDSLLKNYTGEYPENWSKVSSLKILDLGCGSARGYIEPPTMCRLLAANGAEVYGIDLYKGHEEDQFLYTHIVTDLVDIVREGRLAQLPELKGKEFDIINSSRFFGNGLNGDSEFYERLSEIGISLTKWLNDSPIYTTS